MSKNCWRVTTQPHILATSASKQQATWGSQVCFHHRIVMRPTKLQAQQPSSALACVLSHLQVLWPADQGQHTVGDEGRRDVGCAAALQRLHCCRGI